MRRYLPSTFRPLLAFLFIHFLVLQPLTSHASVVDAPHNETNSIACGDCHSYSMWWQYSPASNSGTVANAVCDSCHGDGGAYILAKTHSSTVLGSMHNTSIADWSRNCVDCHNPHIQEQIEWGLQDQQLADELYLVSGFIGAQTGFSSANNTTTFEYNAASALASWEDSTLWPAKSQAGRGLIIAMPKGDASNTYEVIAVSETTAIDSGSGQTGSGTITVQGVVDQQWAGTEFGMIYGQLIKGEINGASGPTAVKFFSPFGGFVDTVGSPPEVPHTGICQICHTQTNHFLASDPNPASDHLNITDSRGMSGPAARCTECHLHVNGFGHGGDGGGVQCTQCHQSGNHTEHLSGGVTCGDCHDLSNMRDVTGQVSLDPLTVSSCDACHNDGRGNGPVQTDFRTAWTDANYTLDCNGCHLQQPGTGSHSLHLTTSKKVDISCDNCHDSAVEGTTAPEQHVDGTIDVYDQAEGDLGYQANKAVASAYGTCATAYCHSGGKGNYAPLAWQDQPAGLGCNGCHGLSTQSGYPDYANTGPGTEMANAHATHSEAANCFYCHYNTSHDGWSILEGGTHINNSFDIQIHPVFNGACSDTAQVNQWDCELAGATWTPSTFTYEAGAKTCSNITCHDAPVQWGDSPANITANCGACHATPPLDNAGAGQPHTIHFGIGNVGGMPQVYGEKHIGATDGYYGFYCGFCHPSGPLAHQNDPSAGTVSDPKKMEIWLGSIDDSGDAISGGGPLARGTTPIYDISQATSSVDPGVAKDVQGAPMFYYGFNTGACLNIYCHSDGQGGAPNQTPIWQLGDAPSDCTYCHGNDATAAVMISSGSHTAHVGTAVLGCVNCHSATVSDNRTIKDKRNHVSNYFDSATGEPLNPGSAAVDVVANSGISFTFTKETGQCASISCHGNTDATWGDATTVSCQACHLGAVDVDDYVYDNQVRAMVEESAWQASGHGAFTAYSGSGNAGAAFNSCSYCHDGTVGHGDATNPFRLANLQGGDGTNGVCLICHGTASSGFDPDGLDPLAAIDSTVKVGDTHFGYKHGTTNNAGQFCWDCHDPHGDNNIFMIHDTVTTLSDGVYGTPLTTSAVSFTAKSTGTDYARSTAPYDGICNVCHTQADHYTATSGDGHNSTLVCTNCHSHEGYAQDTAAGHDNRVISGLTTDCTACHDVLTNGAIDQVKVDSLHRSDCALCHSYSGTKLDVITVAAVIQQGMSSYGNTPQNCQACHQGEAKDLHHQSTAYGAGECNQCHSGSSSLLHDMRSVGSLNCGTCHSVSSAVEIDALHPSCTTCHGYDGGFLDPADVEATITAGIAGTPVDCAGCHTTEHNSAKAHNRRGISGLTTDCTSCHTVLTNGVLDQSLVDGIHGGDCLLCHNYGGTLLDPVVVASVIEAGRSTGGNTEQNCQACHSGEVKTFHHATATYAAGNCTTCHTDDTAILHEMRSIGSLNCGNCHSVSSASEIDALHPSCTTCHGYDGGFLDPADIEATITAGIAGTPVDCSGCHTVEHDTSKAHNRRVVSGLSTDCTSCHSVLSSNTVDQSLVDATHGNDCMLCHNYSGTKLDAATVAAVIEAGRSTGGNADQNCQACHTGSVQEFHHASTIYTAGECGTCHTVSSTSLHDNRSVGSLICGTCHAVSSASEIDSLHSSCTTCHNYQGTKLSRSDVDNTIAAGINGSSVDCTGCHGSGHDTTTAHNNRVISGLDTDCSQCHDVTSSGLVDQAKIDTLHQSDCALCHAYSGSMLNASTVASVIAAGQSSGSNTPQNCQQCHQGEAKDFHHQSAEYSAGNCGSCHTADSSTLHDKRSVGSLGCGNCHTVSSATSIDNMHLSCTTCHAYQGSELDRATVEAAIASGIGGTQVTCQDCHVDGIGLHHATTYYQQGNCEWCHADPRSNWDFSLPGDQGGSGPRPTQLACFGCHMKVYNNVIEINRLEYGSDYSSPPVRTPVHSLPGNLARGVGNYGICFSCHDGSTSAPAVTVFHAKPADSYQSKANCLEIFYAPGRGSFNYFSPLFMNFKTNRVSECRSEYNGYGTPVSGYENTINVPYGTFNGGPVTTETIEVPVFNALTDTSDLSGSTPDSSVSVLQVPAPYKTITQALNVASEGEIIEVDDGTYSEIFTFKDKNVTIRSVNGPLATIIDAAGHNSTAMTFEQGNASTIEGITVQNGDSASHYGRGGGVYVDESSPTFINAIITNNYGQHEGGGFYVTGSGSSLTLVDSTVSNNTTGKGAGIWLHDNTSATISGTTFSGNITDFGSHVGGAIYLGSNAWVTISESSFLENKGQKGGAIYSMGSSVTVSDTIFEGNQSKYEGGAIYNASGNLSLERVIIRGQLSTESAKGPGIYCGSGTATITNAMVTGNSTGNGAEGGGMYNGSCTTTITNSTFAGNSAMKGGGLYRGGGSVTVRNSIFWGNSAMWSPIQLNADSVTYSAVEGGFSGTGNIDTDPWFIDERSPSEAPTTAGDYHLGPGSPCEGAANSTYAPADDFEGDSRPYGSGYDMGADEDSVPVNNPPVLSWAGEIGYTSDGVEPNSGQGGSLFTFLVSYADQDNQLPGTIQLWLDSNDNGYGSYEESEKFDLAEVDQGDTDLTDGKLYLLSLSLTAAGDGLLNYRFYATDGLDPASGMATANRMVTVQ